MKQRIYTILTRSGLHCGIGQGLSDIDLPTAKESVTGFPFIPGSSLKGVLRDRFDDGSTNFRAAFGPDPENASDYASALSFSDARLVCLPVRSWFGTFAYMTCPTALGICRQLLGQTENSNLPSIPSLSRIHESYQVAIASESVLTPPNHNDAAQILLEDLDLTVAGAEQDKATAWAGLLATLFYPEDQEAQSSFKKRFAVVDDDVMAFLCETGLPVAAHNAIGENGIVKTGALWYEEYVPAETFFAGAIYACPPKLPKTNEDAPSTDQDLLDCFCASPIHTQVGGSATTGRGLITISFSGMED
ncbi:type III-B CRISPR module RAMP protein Cmr4 [Desulfobacter hydrogenophilus]|uniref:Type III-B CRISPR module RAMP protein Cmr4 n=1 Tax=Desulfobacter hydrogenophilus TaxID=2291 RepID=A0A328FCT5_9BACT|nr:type III-B CRISPR module RAMP protein Cmr4 [Desulfobacter hydrogenophilus]NDY71657.1 type III-B CRISPR module RAMP protein Cmr4 [Desulfobacter hydrogenophilus]QBH13171.1 type III-B CRISPR module RAMP protein Cmr4 [Desulfobacter hydrogenophilus]RAM02408.1 type III-B CRISPR module RAMP protein Cmr4 [Desulfobacter hydrogenophilus]